jgi:hypothetical protein
MVTMPSTNTPNDLARQLAATLASRDATRLTQLKFAASLAAAEQSALQNEQKRLSAKYGATSAQATAAASGLKTLGTENDALTSAIARSSVELPKSDAGQFLVTGTILDANGKGLRGAKITATDANGKALASGSSKVQGQFELRVPVKAPAKPAANEAAAQPPVSLQLVIAHKSLQQPYTYPETFAAVGGRLAYRQIPLTGNPAP